MAGRTTHHGSEPMHTPSVPNENCLCDGQPISLAMAYVKPQPFGEVFGACEGWHNGTLFPALVMPYCMGGKRR